MRKFLTIVFTMLLACSLAFGQNTGGDKAKTGGTTKDTTGKKPAATSSIESKTKTKSKKGHKGGKKGKGKGKGKSTGTGTGAGATPPPK